MKIEEINLIEFEHKTIRKFKHTGTLRLQNLLINIDHKSAMETLVQICEGIDCNFTEVLSAINRTTR